MQARSPLDESPVRSLARRLFGQVECRRHNQLAAGSQPCCGVGEKPRAVGFRNERDGAVHDHHVEGALAFEVLEFAYNGGEGDAFWLGISPTKREWRRTAIDDGDLERRDRPRTHDRDDHREQPRISGARDQPANMGTASDGRGKDLDLLPPGGFRSAAASADRPQIRPEEVIVAAGFALSRRDVEGQPRQRPQVLVRGAREAEAVRRCHLVQSLGYQ